MERADVDVLAMQETKCHDDAFPLMSFLASGYDIAHVGQGAYNGVAIASRVGLDAVEIAFDGVPTYPVDGQPIREARAISAVCAGIRVWSLYVPNGRTPDDPHYDYKLRWLDALADHIELRLAHDPATEMMLAGDWNVAQRDDDVWDPSYFEGRTHVTAPERAAVQRFLDGGLVDSGSPTHPDTRSGTTHSCGSRATRACGSTTRSAPCPRHADPGRARRPRGAQTQGRQRSRAGGLRDRLSLR